MNKSDKYKLAEMLVNELLQISDLPLKIREELERDFDLCNKKLKQNVDTKHSTINFTDTYIIVSGKSYSKRLLFLLCEKLILRDNIHWVWGFVYFSEWTRGNTLSKHPRDQFANYISKLKTKIENNIFSIENPRKTHEWKITYLVEDAYKFGNMFAAKKHYEDALAFFNNGDISSAVDKIDLAISIKNYDKFYYIDAYLLLIKAIMKLCVDKFENRLLEKTKDFLRWYWKRLEEAIYVVEQIYIKNNLISESEVEHELRSLKKLQKEAKKYCDLIFENIPLTQEDIEIEELANLVYDLRMMISEEFENYDTLKHVFLSDQFLNLIKNHHIQSILQEAEEFYGEKYSHLNDLDNKHITYYSLLEILTGICKYNPSDDNQIPIGIITFDKYTKLYQLKENLLKKMKESIKDPLIKKRIIYDDSINYSQKKI